MKGKNDMARKTELLYMKLCHQLMIDYQNKPYYSPLPGERELCEIYKVSRPTVRKALEVLESEGCIVRFAGKGAFFIGNKQEESEDENPVSTNIAFYNQVRLRGDYTRSKVLSQKGRNSRSRSCRSTSDQAGRQGVLSGKTAIYQRRIMVYF